MNVTGDENWKLRPDIFYLIRFPGKICFPPFRLKLSERRHHLCNAKMNSSNKDETMKVFVDRFLLLKLTFGMKSFRVKKIQLPLILMHSP